MDIDGKEVKFKPDLPASFVWEIIPILQTIKRGDNIIAKIPWETAVRMVQNTVESWEFDGDPLDDEWYASLSAGQVMDVFAPMLIGCYAHLCGLVTGTSKDVKK